MCGFGLELSIFLAESLQARCEIGRRLARLQAMRFVKFSQEVGVLVGYNFACLS